MRMGLKKDIAGIVILLALSLLGTDCATTKKISNDILGKGTNLKKKIALLPVLNRSGYGGDDFRNAAAKELKSEIRRRCDGLHLLDSREIRQALEEIRRLPSGQIDNFSLANMGRIHGLHAVVEESVVDVELISEKWGIWGFRRMSPLLQVSIRLRVYDVQTTAVLLDELVKEAVQVSGEERQNIKERNLYNREITYSLLAKVAPEAAEMICNRMAEEPWKGYITASSGNTFTISAGTEAGLAPEVVLEVFAMGEPIEGKGNRVYLVPGPKMGEIKLTKVRENQAEAVALFGHDLERSSCVMLKP